MNLPVRAFVDPIRGFAGAPREFERPDRATLADVIALVPLDNEALRPLLRVKLGGVLIDPSLYRRVLPKRDAFLTVVLPVHGGDNNLLGTIAAIALIGASLFVGGFGVPFLGAAFAAGTTGASLVAGGLSIAASLLLQGLNAPQQAGGASSDAKQIGVATAQNSFEPGAYLPRVLGTRKISPPMVMPPYTEIISDDSFVTAVYGLAGPHEIGSLKIGSSEIAEAEDVEYEIREGFASDTDLTLVTRTVIEDGVSIALSRFVTTDGHILDTTASPNTPFWHRVETKASPDAVTLVFSLGQGFGYVGGAVSNKDAVSAVRIRMRQKGTSTWINLPEFPFYGVTLNRPVRLMINLLWTAPADMPGSVTAPEERYMDWFFKHNTVTPSAGPTWTADSYFLGNVASWRDKNWDIYLNTSTFPKDRYEIEVIRGYTVRVAQFNAGTHAITASFADRNDFFQSATSGADQVVAETQSEFSDALSLAVVQSIWNEYPFNLTGQPTALIAIRAKNRSIDQVNCIASGLTDDWNGSAWVADQVTSNPASRYREVLGGDLNAEPVPSTLIDSVNLQDWHEWNTAQGHEVNAIVQGQPVPEVLSIVAQAGFARPRYGATYGVVIDRPRDPVGLITQRNAAGFSFQKPFGRLPHALKVNLADAANDYEVRELIVYDDGYAAVAGGGLLEATRFESATYPGITAEAQAEARAQRDMRFAKHRSRLLNFTMDIEHLEFQLGDLVLVETDILGQVGGRGRVSLITTSGGLVTGLVLDEQRDFTHADANSLPRAVAMRLADGTVRVERVTADDSNLNAVTFSTPFAMPSSGGDDLIFAGTLVASGTLGFEARRVLIWDMAPGPDLTCQITGIDYAEAEIYRLFQSQASFAGAGAFSAAGRRIRNRSVVIAGHGTLTTNFSSATDTAVAFAGAGSLSVLVRGSFVRSAAMAGVGTIAAAPRRIRPGAAAFSGSGTLTAIGLVLKLRGAAFAGAGGLNATFIVTRRAVVAFAGAGSMAAASTKTVKRSVAFAGVGTLSSSRGRDFSADFNNDFR